MLYLRFRRDLPGQTGCLRISGRFGGPKSANRSADCIHPGGIVRLGGYNHSIGLATHDVMGTFAGPDEVLAPGFVFACDIQLFSLKEEIGIRIEDTIAITGSGCEILSLGVPRTVAEIEALMRQDGILQTLGEKRF